MKFLVVGANGFVGSPLCKELARRGEFCRAAVRSGNLPIKNIEFLETGLIDGQTNWSDALRGIDVVIHLAARVHVMRALRVYENSDIDSDYS